MSLNKKLFWGGLGWVFAGPIGAILGYAYASINHNPLFENSRTGQQINSQESHKALWESQPERSSQNLELLSYLPVSLPQPDHVLRIS